MTFLIILLISKLLFCEATPIYINDKFYEEISDNNKHRIQDDKIPERDVSNIINYRLSNNIIPEHYVMKLDLSNVKNYKISSIYGEISIDLRIIHPTKTVDFHAQRPYIKIRNYIFLQRLNSGDKYVINDLVEKSYIPSSHIFVLYFAEELSQGNYILKMEFDCNADETKSFFQTTYINTRKEKEWLAATRFQGIGARQVFPCWDEPALRATFSIGIKHHSNYTVLSNMHTYKVDPVTTNIVWRIFEVTSPIPTHLVGFTICDPTSVYSISYSEWLPSHLTFAQNISKIIGNNLSAFWLNITTNVEEMQHVAIPNFPDNVMVNWGLNFYRLSDIIYEEGKDSVMRKIKVARLIAWGIIQQFIFNMLSLSWWSSLWLNDGITMSFVTDVLNEIFPDTQIMDLFAVEYQYESLHLDCGLLKPLTWKIINSSDINSIFLYPRYAKAVTILNMLRYMLIDYSDKGYIDNFQYDFRRYFLKFFFKAATFDDLWVTESAQVELLHTDKDVNVSQIINAWITQPQYPVLNIKQNNKTTNKVIVLSEKFNVSRIDHWISFFFNTTVKILKKNSTTFNNNTLQKISDESIKIVEFLLENYEDEKENVESLLSLNGYFRVNYDVPIWERIIHFLVPKDFRNSPKEIELSTIIKAKLIDDAFHFVVAGELNSEIFWKMSQFLTAESNYIVWYPMFKVFEYISRILPLTEFSRGTDQQIKEDVQFLYRNYKITFSYIDFRELLNDILTNCLMQEISKWACVFDYDECIIKAKYYLMDHITNPSVNKIVPWWTKWTFCYGMGEEYQIWARVLQFWYNISDSKESSQILEFLCCTKNIEAIKLMLAKGQDKKIYGTTLSSLQVRDHINIFSLIIVKHARNKEVLKYILFNFKELKPRKISTVAALINIINHLYSREQLVLVEIFVLNNLRELYMDVSQKVKTRWLQIITLNNDLINLIN